MTVCLVGSTESSSSGGMVFGIPLGVCVENEKARTSLRSSDDHELRRKSHHGSRGSFSSLIESTRPDEVKIMYYSKLIFFRTLINKINTN